MAMDRDAARKRVLDITSVLLADGGLEAVKIREIAKQAGVSIGSIYNLFGDGDDLLRAANTRLLDELGAAGAMAVARIESDGVTDVRERLLMLSRVYHEFVSAHDRAWNALLAFNRSMPNTETPEWYMVRQEMLFDIIADVLRDTSLADDETRLLTAARALWSSVHGIVTNGFRGTDARTVEENTWAQIDILVTTFVHGLQKP